MPTILIFGPPRESTEPIAGAERDGLEVAEDPNDVLAELQGGGFARFTFRGTDEPVWINTSLVRFFREGR